MRFIYFVIIALVILFKTASGQLLYSSINMGYTFANMARINQDLVFAKASNAVYINDTKTQASFTKGIPFIFGFGIGADIRMLNIQLSANWSPKSLSYKVRYPIGPDLDKEYIGEMDFNNIDIPLLFGTTLFNSKLTRMYVEIGASCSYNIGGSSTEFWGDLSSIHENDLYEGILYKNSRYNIFGKAGIGVKFGPAFLILKYDYQLTGLSKGNIVSYFSLNLRADFGKKENSTRKYVHFENIE
jgi:hypothetical protein